MRINTSNQSAGFLEEHPTLVLDTRHFKVEFTDRLLASFDDLDGMMDGLLVNSENWQALNLAKETYNKAVKTVYIDPPYNSPSSEIIYKNGYKYSTFLSLMGTESPLASLSWKTKQFT